MDKYGKGNSRFMKGIFGSKVEIIESEDLVLNVLRGEDIVSVIRILRDHTGFDCKSIVDITCVDWKSELEIVYELMSIKYNKRVRVKCLLVGKDYEVESIFKLFGGANWLEREVYDMFGVYFVNHPDLRRLLTDYGFKGKALRKDFRGGYELKYDEEKKSVVKI